MIRAVNYGRNLDYGAFGRNGAMHQSGLNLMLMERDQEIWINSINSRGRFSTAARMSIPIDKIDNVIEVLQSMKAKALEERNLLGFAEANREIATVT